MPTWTAPETWETNDLVTAAMMNQQVLGNLEFLKTPPTAVYNVNQGSNYTTTSTSFTDVDATNLALTIVTAGGDVMIGFIGTLEGDAINIYLDVALDGTRMGGDDGIGMIEFDAGDAADTISFVYLKTNLAAGSHTFKLQWKKVNGAGSGAATLYAGAGTSTFDLHPQFWVREVS